MKKYTVSVLNNETQETQQFEFEGYVLGGVIGRSEKRFQSGVTAQSVEAIEVAQMFRSLKERDPNIQAEEQAFMMEEIFGRLGVATNEEDDNCDCEVCSSRRDAEGADIQ